MALNPNAFVDGVMDGFSLHIEPPSYVQLPSVCSMCESKGGQGVLTHTSWKPTSSIGFHRNKQLEKV